MWIVDILTLRTIEYRRQLEAEELKQKTWYTV